MAPFALTCYALQFKFLPLFFFLSLTTIFLSVLFHSSKELMNQPVSMPCGHSACKACLLEMISKQSIGSRPCTCLLCWARIEGDKLNVNVTVSALIGRIQVRCTNVSCSWVGMHSKKETHMDTCPFMVIDCPNGTLFSLPHRSGEIDAC